MRAVLFVVGFVAADGVNTCLELGNTRVRGFRNLNTDEALKCSYGNLTTATTSSTSTSSSVTTETATTTTTTESTTTTTATETKTTTTATITTTTYTTDTTTNVGATTDIPVPVTETVIEFIESIGCCRTAEMGFGTFTPKNLGLNDCLEECKFIISLQLL